MKKILIRIGLGLLVLVIAGVIVVGLFLGNIIKAGMETVGPKITQTSLKVNSVSVSMLGGSAGVKGLVLGNPEGFKTAQAMSVGKAAVSVAPMSILSDKVVIRSVEVRDAEITFEGSPFGANNLNKIMENVNAIAGGGKAGTNAAAQAGAKKPAKKLEVDDFLIIGAKVHVSLTGMGGKEMTLPLPDIHIRDLGKDGDGITIHLMACGSAAPKIIIIHSRKIIVNQGICMNEFQCACEWKQLFCLRAERLSSGYG